MHTEGQPTMYSTVSRVRWQHHRTRSTAANVERFVVLGHCGRGGRPGVRLNEFRANYYSRKQLQPSISSLLPLVRQPPGSMQSLSSSTTTKAHDPSRFEIDLSGIGTPKIAKTTDITRWTTTNTSNIPSSTRSSLKWTPEVDQTVIRLRQEGKTFKFIGEKVGRHFATVMQRYESMLNPELKTFWTPEREQILDRLVASGKPWGMIGRELGVHRLAVQEKWREIGIQQSRLSVLEAQEQKKLETRMKKVDLSLAKLGVIAEANTALKTAATATMDISETKVQEERELAAAVNDAFMYGMKTNLRNAPKIPKPVTISSESSSLDNHRDQPTSMPDSFPSASGVTMNLFSVVNPGWSVQQETILIQHVLARGLDDWDTISKELGEGPNHSPEACRTLWKKLDMPAMPVEPTVSSPSLTSSPSIPAHEMKSAGWSQSEIVKFWKSWLDHGSNWNVISEDLTKAAVSDDIVADKQGVKGAIAMVQRREQISRQLSPHECQKYFDQATRDFKGPEDFIEFQVKTYAKDIVVKATTTAATTASKSGARPRWKKADSVHLQKLMALKYNLRPTTTPPPRSSDGFVEIDGESSMTNKPSYHQTALAESWDWINWKWVARNLEGSGMTPAQCRHHWKYLHFGAKLGSIAAAGSDVDDYEDKQRWKSEDIKQLEEGIRQVGTTHSKWAKVIKDFFLPDRSVDEITKRWYLISSKSTTMTEEEYYRLMSAVTNSENAPPVRPPLTFDEESANVEKDIHDDSDNEDKNDKTIAHKSTEEFLNNYRPQQEAIAQFKSAQHQYWTKISSELPGWKTTPCRRVWECTYQYWTDPKYHSGGDKDMSKSSWWTDEQDKLLLRAVESLGQNNWYTVAKQLGKESGWQCRLRWCQISPLPQL